MCRGERGRDSLTFVFVNEDGEKDAVHEGSVLEDAHWLGSPSDFTEPSFDGVCGSDLLALYRGGVSETGEQPVEVMAQTYGFIRSAAVTDAACHDGRMLRRIVTSDNLAAGVWADTAYRSKANEA